MNNNKLTYDQMLRISLDSFIKQGLAFIPTETNGIGEQTKVIYKKGEKLLNCDTNRFLHHLADVYGCNCKVLRQNYGAKIYKKQFVPLPFSHDLTLVPFPSKMTSNPNHKLAWLSLNAMQSMYSHPTNKNQGIIRLKNSEEVHILKSIKFIEQQYKNAELIKFKYLELHQLESNVLLRDRKTIYFH